MKNTVAFLCGAALWFSTALPLRADIVLALNPAQQNALVGSQVNVALTISGLGSGTAPSLSTFDVDIVFDEGILSFASATFGDPVLGDQLDLSLFGNISSIDATLPGIVNLFELSLDPVSTLNSLQAGNFTLATLTFKTLRVGTSPLGIVSTLGDANGDPLIPNTIQNGSATVVPEPAAISLLGIVAGVFVYRCRRMVKRT